MRCSGAVLLRVGRNGGRYCTCKSTLLPAGPAWCTAWGLRALHQRGLVVHRRGWQAAGEAPTESLTLSRKISSIRWFSKGQKCNLNLTGAAKRPPIGESPIWICSP